MTDPRALFLHRCTVAIRAITRRDAEACRRLVLDHAAAFEAARTAPSIGRAARLGCVAVLERPGAAAARATADTPLGIAAAVARQVALETRLAETALGIRARTALAQA